MLFLKNISLKSDSTYFLVYHWADTQLKMRFMGFTPTRVEKLNESMAIDLGADLLGEVIIFSIAAVTIYLEYWRSSSKEQRKEIAQNMQLTELDEKVQELVLTVEEQNAKLREVMHRLAEVDSVDYKKTIQFVITKEEDKEKGRKP